MSFFPKQNWLRKVLDQFQGSTKPIQTRRRQRTGLRLELLEDRLAPAGFSSPLPGTTPYAGLVQDNSGDFFGTASGGGTYGYGTVFEAEALDRNVHVSLVATFNGTNGANPYAGLALDGSGNLFGTTSSGGANGDGTVFEVVNGSSTITPLASFNGTNGANPYGGLVLDGSGNLFGTTSSGGANSDGTVFEVVNGSNTITLLASFNGTNGANPYAGLLDDGSGNLFGTTTSGGAKGVGNVFEVLHGSNTIEPLACFNGTNGANPFAGLVLDGSGNLFGTTTSGGANNSGTLFKLVGGTHTITPIFSFNNGDSPGSDLLTQDSNGNLFGAIPGSGKVFEVLNGTNTINILDSIPGEPNGGLVLDSSGNLIGTTRNGGSTQAGNLFEVFAPQVLILATTPAYANPNNEGTLLTNASTVSYMVTFPEPVTGVDPSEFVLTTSGTVTATLIDMQPIAGSNGAAYSVTVNGIEGSGTLGLDLNNAVGQIYTIDRVPPVVQGFDPADGWLDPIIAGNVLANGSSSIAYYFNFSKPVIGVDTSDFVPSTTGTLAIGSIQVQPLDGTDGAGYSVTVGGMTGEGTLGLKFLDNSGISDLAGNGLQLGTGNVFGPVYTVVPDPPVVLSFVGSTPANPDPNDPGALLTNASSVSYTITFSGPVTGVNASDFRLAVPPYGFSISSIQVTPVAASNGTAYTVTVNGIMGNGELIVGISALSGILDQSGFAFYLTGPNNSQTYTIDQVSPVLQTITLTSPASFASLVTSASSVSYAVTFSKPVTGVDPTAFVLTKTGTVATTSTQATVDPNNPNNWIVTISGITGDGTLGLQLANNNHIFDLAGNALSLAFAGVTLQSLPTISLGQGQSLMAVADINGDGKDDLIIANSVTNSMSVMLSNGDGTFQSSEPFAVGVAPFNGVMTDVNGDGKPDIVMVNSGTVTISVLLNNGNGTFQAPQTYITSNDGTVAKAVAVADINGDGKPDIVVANADSYDGFWQNPVVNESGNVSVLLNNGDGTFQPPQQLVEGWPIVNANSLAVADVNGDGKPVIAVGTAGQYYYGDHSFNYSGRVVILSGDASGDFVDSLTLTPPNNGNAPLQVAVTDLNGDGNPDVVFATSSGSITAELNNGDGTFTTAIPLPQGAGPAVPFGADLTGDGKADDLVVNNPTANTVSIFHKVPPVYTIDTPTAHIAADPNATPAKHMANLLLTATDTLGSQELAAGFTYAINWGDGTAQNPDITTVNATANNGSGVPVSHTYADGSYQVSVTATNKDGAVSAAATGLVVVSSQAGDSIALSGGASAGQVAVSVNNASPATFNPTDLVDISGQGGNDAFTVNFGSTLTTPITIAGSNSSGDTLTVNGDSTSTNVITKTPGQITWGSPVTETVSRSGIPNTVINANGTSNNYVNDPGGNTTINGGPGANTIVITATTGNGVVINGGPTTNTYVTQLGNLLGPLTIANSNQGASDTLVINAPASGDAIGVAGNEITQDAQAVVVTAPLADLHVNDGSSNDMGGTTVNVSSLSVPVQSLTLNGNQSNFTVAPSESQSVTYTDVSQSPTASAGGPYVITFGQGLSLDGSASSDPEGNPLQYSWTINGQAGAAVGVQPVLSFAALQALGVSAGQNNSISLTVNDGLGHIVTSAAMLTVNQATPTLTINGGPFPYDGTPHAATVVATGVDGAIVNGTFTVSYNGKNSIPKAAGSYTVQVTFTSSDPNYTNATGAGSITINSATPTIAVSGGPFTYDGNAHAAKVTATSGGAVSGSFMVTYNGSSAVPIDAGTYNVVVTFTSSNASYTNATGSGTITINPAVLTIKALNAHNTYGQTLTLLDTAFKVSGLVSGDAVSSVTLTSAGTSPTAAATAGGTPYAIVPSAAIGSGLSNYTINYVDGKLWVHRAALTITANDATKTYGQTVTFAGTEFAVSGLVNSDSVTSLTLTSAGAGATAGVAHSPYNIVPSAAVGTGLSNYKISYVTGCLTVNAATPTATASGGPFTYDGNSHAAKVQATGVTGDNVTGDFTVTYNGTATVPTEAGTYTVQVTFASDNANYGGATGTGSITINPATPKIKVTGGTFTYEGTADAATATATGVGGVSVNGSFTFTYNGSPIVPTNAGTYDVTAAFTSSDNDYASVTVTVTGSIVINQAKLKVTVNNDLMLQGNSPPVFTGTITGLVSGDNVTANYATTATSASPVGIYSISATLSGSAAGNYQLQLNAGTLYVVTVGADTDASGGEGITFWDNSGNNIKIKAKDLTALDQLNLVGATGSSFDPTSAAQLQAWLQSATASNLSYWLSAQLADMELNVLTGYVKTTDIVYAGQLMQYNTVANPILGLDSGGFITIGNLMAEANAALATSAVPVGSGFWQAYEQALAQVLLAANGNSTFVQQSVSGGP